MSLSKTPVVVDTSTSPHCQLRPVPVDAVTLRDPLWAPRRKQLVEVLLPGQYQMFEETGRLDNFRRAAGKRDGEFQGRYYNDSDVYKWLEGAAWMLASEKSAQIQELASRVIELIVDAQDQDGYLNTYFVRERRAERWTNLRDLHELYCAGHLIQAAIADRRATGRETLYGVALRLADHICERFGGDRVGTSGHAEIEMALVELSRESGERRYLEQAIAFLDRRGRGQLSGLAYHQDRVPLRELSQMEGHAVRGMYLVAGAVDGFIDSGDESLWRAADVLWDRMVQAQLYVTGGVGSRFEGEAFGEAYELPNERAYAETCAAIASVMWSWRMLQVKPEVRYADLIETTLYNAILCGVSLDGTRYFYDNPLASSGQHERKPWFTCACCPPNVSRLLALLPSMFYSVRGDEVLVHLYAESKAEVTLASGRTVELEQRTRYPWQGDVEIEVATAGEFALALRIPSWAQDARVLVAGQAFATTTGSYLQIRRVWRAGDVVRLEIPMPARLLASHRHVMSNQGRAAILRGPLVYCVQGVDNGGLDPRDLLVDPSAEITEQAGDGIYEGMTTLELEATLAEPDTGSLYRPLTTIAPATRRQRVSAIPYWAWANRGPSTMEVWLRVLASDDR